MPTTRARLMRGKIPRKMTVDAEFGTSSADLE